MSHGSQVGVDLGFAMLFGDMVGAKKVLSMMEKIGAENDRFAPAKTLKELAASGGRFIDVQPG